MPKLTAADHFAAAERQLKSATEYQRQTDLANVHLGLATAHLRAAEYLRAAEAETPAEAAVTPAAVADRIASVQRGGTVTAEQRTAAGALLADLLTAAARHGVTLEHFDWVADLPGACLDVACRRS